MSVSSNGNCSYEEVRKQRLEENKKKIQDLGIFSLTKSLSETKKSVKKSVPKLKRSTATLDTTEVRRSSRSRNAVVPYSEEFHTEMSYKRNLSKSLSSQASYLSRPVEEVRFASDKERAYAMECAEDFRYALPSNCPSFVKSMVRSHVYSSFSLGLPVEFYLAHLPSVDMAMVLEDEDGSEYDVSYKGEKRSLTVGWRAFAVDHKLDDGDALVFELTEPKIFKVYIFRVRELEGEKAAKNHNRNDSVKSNKKVAKKADKKSYEILEDSDDSDF